MTPATVPEHSLCKNGVAPSNSMTVGEEGYNTASFGTMVCGASKDAEKFRLDIPRSEVTGDA